MLKVGQTLWWVDRVKQTIPREEIDNWPEYGDATAFRIKNGRRIIKKEKF